MTLGQRVEARRIELGLTKSAAARRAGVSRGTWYEVETDRRQDLHPDTYFAIDRALEWDRGTARAHAQPSSFAEVEMAAPTDAERMPSSIAAQMTELHRRMAAIEQSPPWFAVAVDVLRELSVDDHELVIEIARLLHRHRRG
jgi:DNA-binding XRE family transcriptional regulator